METNEINKIKVEANVETNIEHSNTLSTFPNLPVNSVDELKKLQLSTHLTLEKINELINLYIKEKALTRRWRKLFRYMVLICFLIMFGIFLFKNTQDTHTNEPHVALIKLEGEIDYNSPASAELMITALQTAFEDKSSVAIILKMNSPGGSPVQSNIINAEIIRLRNQYKNKLIYTVIEEVCASGCYYIAAATHAIYANSASMVGSIGVIMDSFGAVDLIKKLGIERRVYTAGHNKNFLDPFTLATDKQKYIIDTLLNDVHQQFIQAVKIGRGNKLKDDGELFSGRIYSGNQAVKVGLVDQIASMGELMRNTIKNETIIDYSPKENLAERVAKKFGASIGAYINSHFLNLK